ncbi:TetR/AcrR family transcriptional regulator [Saccharopolyspora rhizosphaerae]|uniref:TetR/AcrR family transcriptional regulator n=1 Tax=Saccharopolyspora rhizosphaerae TaxID=2492662 RepID=UPI0018F75C47|nr:TetR/AcrR family transcriptional regulator [Saccharopolyspora rhizosphaerae]
MDQDATPAAAKPSLTDRRKAALRLEIARATVDLFASQGVAATKGEQIARAVGISTRTLWRHFPSKQSCVRPLLAESLDAATEQLRHCPPDTGLLTFLIDTCERGTLPEADPAVLDLIRMTGTDPALRAVWLQAHDEALPVLRELLAERAGASPDDLRIKVHAATINGALRAAAEEFAQRSATEPDMGPADLAAILRSALRTAAEGLPY